MNRFSHVGCFCFALLCLFLGCGPSQAQTVGTSDSKSRTYECPANGHCNISCSVDGEKQVQTGTPKTVTMTPLGPSSYLLELVEQSGHTLFAYLAGTKVVCILDGVTKGQ
jgi:hypothetical protein